MKRKWLQALLTLLSLGLAVTLVVYLPSVVHVLTGKDVSWTQIGTEFAGIGVGMIGLMALLWIMSLLAYTFVLTGSMPGLTHLQALTLNAAGSAVSNLLPFGGAAGTALTFAMSRGWGFGTRQIVVMAVVSGIWNTLSRFILPAVGIMALLVAGKPLSPTIVNAGWVGALYILILAAVVVAALYWDRAAAVLGRVLDRSAKLLPQKIRPSEHGASTGLEKLRTDTSAIVRHRWPGLTFGMVFFLGLQWAIMLTIMHATGAYPGFAQSIAVFALSRVLTTAVITPSGAGIMEAGTVAFLLFFGVDPAAAAATALIFGFWTYTVEIPFGGLALGAWALLRRRDGRSSATPPPSESLKSQP